MLVTWKYRSRDTFIQSLDPRARLTFMACLILAITATDVWDVRLLLPIFAISMVLYFMARIEWRDVRRAWLFILFFILFIIGLNALLGGRGGPLSVLQDDSQVLLALSIPVPLTPWRINFSITVVRSFFALVQMMRMITMASLAIPIPYTIDPSIYGVTFRRMGASDKISFTMDLAFRFVPTLGRDFMITMDAQRARGYELESARGGLIQRLRRLAPLLVPVTMQAIVNGEEVIDAMDLRAFGARRRTWLRELHFQRRDYWFMALGVAILIIMVVVRVLGYGEFWVPEFWYRLAGT